MPVNTQLLPIIYCLIEYDMSLKQLEWQAYYVLFHIACHICISSAFICY